MTDAEKNRAVAEACEYETAYSGTSDWVGDDTVYVSDAGPIGPWTAFDPLHDANQAIAALDKVFHIWECLTDTDATNPATRYLINGWTSPGHKYRSAFGPDRSRGAQSRVYCNGPVLRRAGRDVWSRPPPLAWWLSHGEPLST